MNRILEQDFEYVLNDKNINWNKFSGKTVLIAGACGFLPVYMLKTLLTLNKKKLYQPIRVIALVRNKQKAKEKLDSFFDDENLFILEQDVKDKINCQKKIDFIIHAASQASPKYFFSNPVDVINANILGTINLLELAVENKVEGFLFFSTGEVNGNIYEKKDCVAEDDYGVVDPLELRNCYAESKRMGENICVAWYSQYNVPVKIIRPSHTYGPGVDLNDGRVFSAFVSAILKNENIVLNSDGSAKRSFCYIADAIRAYFLVLLEGKVANAYNVSNDYEISIKELAEIILSLSDNKNLELEFNISNSVSSKSTHGLLDNSKIKKLGWYPQIKEQEGFIRTIESFR